MRKLVLVGALLVCLWPVKTAVACGPHNDDAVQIIIVPPSSLAMQQSQTFLADAMKLDGKAATEESASASALSSARMERRKARSIRIQAAQFMGSSRGALLAKADRLDAQAMVNEANSATYLARASKIRARAKALRALSTQVLTSGAVTAQVLPRVALLAPPAGHPDAMALRVLDAAPKMMNKPMPRPLPTPVRALQVAFTR